MVVLGEENPEKRGSSITEKAFLPQYRYDPGRRGKRF